MDNIPFWIQCRWDQPRNQTLNHMANLLHVQESSPNFTAQQAKILHKWCVLSNFHSPLSTGLSFNFSASCSQEHWGRQPATCCLHPRCLCSGSSSGILIKELSWNQDQWHTEHGERKKTKLAPKPVGTMIVLVLHYYYYYQCVYSTQQWHFNVSHSSSYYPTLPEQCLTAPATTSKRNKSGMCLSEILQGNAAKNIFNLSRNCVSLSLSRHQSISPGTIWGKMRRYSWAIMTFKRENTHRY